MINEEQFVKSTFKKHFEKFKNERIAIYGLGKITKVVLEEFPDFPIVALMDEVKTGELIWGLPVLSCEDAHKRGVSIIVIIARAANVPIIYRRIVDECAKFNIKVFDINGDEIIKTHDEYKCPVSYSQLTKAALEDKIKKYDVISFDIFDTLLMRRVLYPTDIFIRVEETAKRQGLIDKNYDFYKERIKAERELYISINPTIFEIYDKLVNNTSISSEIAKCLMELELLEEGKQLIARQDMIHIVNLAYNLGKVICCTSDMYLTKEILANYLKSNGFDKFEQIFISCEHRTSKCGKLFSVLKSAFPNMRILHIGDNIEADIRMAYEMGIDEAFHIKSGLQMLEDSTVSLMLDYTNSISNREYIGDFVARQFNSPFAFETTKGKCVINSCYQLGYSFIEPIITSFLKWMLDEIKNEGIEVLLLGSRDGWIIKKLLDVLNCYEEIKIPYYYFYASRSACTFAGVKNNKDIMYAASLAFAGDIKEKISARFDLNEDEIFDRDHGESEEDYILRHSSLILERSKKNKDRYKRYRGKLPFDDDKKIGFFDFVSSGTCQMWLEGIFSWDIRGLYFLRIYDDRKANLSINSHLEQGHIYEKQKNKLYDNYFFMENIITSPEPTLRNFDDDGNMVFEKENRNSKQLEDLNEIQRGILDGFIDGLNNGDIRSVSKELADTILSFVRKEYSIMNIDYFEDNHLKDEFCNRIFDLNTMIR